MPFLAPIGVAILPGLAAGSTAASVVGAGTLLAGGLSLAGLGKSLFGKQQQPSVPALPTPSSTQTSSQLSKSAELTAQKERLDTARRKRTGTVLTSPQGLLSQSETSNKSLLGG